MARRSNLARSCVAHVRVGVQVAFAVLTLVVLRIPAFAAVDTLYVVPGSHLDIGFTCLPSATAAVRVKILDNAIATARIDPQFRWTEEGGWVIEQWLNAHHRDVRAVDNLRSLLREGRISVSAAYLTPHTAVIPELQRALTIHLPLLKKQFGYTPAFAILNDVPSHPQSVIDALAAKGVKYLLIGANMGFSRALPTKLVRTPFYWQSEHGKRILTFVDPANYCGSVQFFGLGPECARQFNPRRFTQGMTGMEIMRAGIADLLSTTTSSFRPLVIQQAYDNWDVDCAKDLLDNAKQWNAAGHTPVIKLAAPEEYFHRIESQYAKNLPVYREEWGGQWDEIRAVSPVWTWRIREAAKLIAKHPSHDAWSAVLLAMDHNIHLGEIWPNMFTLAEVRSYARECADLFGAAVKRSTSNRDALTAVPQLPAIPPSTALTAEWKKLIAADRPLRIRSGHWAGTPFVESDGPLLNAPLQYGVASDHIAATIHIDRRTIPTTNQQDVSVVVEIPLRAPIAKLHIAPVESPAAQRNAWLRPPQFVVAADGVRIAGLARPITIHAPLIFSWMLISDPKDKNITWLQGLVVRQTLFCQLKGGGTTVLPFDAWFPGEPAVVDVGVRIQ